MWQSTTTSGALGHLGVGADRLAAELGSASASALARSTSATSTGSPMPRASAVAMFPAPMSPSFTPGSLADGASAAYDWLKKPFSISRARSSAETSTLRGVSRNTLSAIRCMPPSSA